MNFRNKFSVRVFALFSCCGLGGGKYHPYPASPRSDRRRSGGEENSSSGNSKNKHQSAPLLHSIGAKLFFGVLIL